MSDQNDPEREFDLKWADDAEHKEPSARARMLAARWKHNPPGPVPFRPDPGPGRRRRSPRLTTIVVLGCVAAGLAVLLWARMRGAH
ncbi:hypothetical protein [Streptomyces sp. MUM 2J]|uniref:SCO2583/SCO2584 N-terminal domain-containing protein n=1 Tax=Streptomyces sp. MUM 2J TaxID=2791987 RepID=UPI001F04F147|nr:hypothetical protein [Streptomyces sp. MUM 2J]MCH0565027.1 hypothetical protein [Streptomyces sp. MUM 2J]